MSTAVHGSDIVSKIFDAMLKKIDMLLAIDCELRLLVVDDLLHIVGLEQTLLLGCRLSRTVDDGFFPFVKHRESSVGNETMSEAFVM